MQKHLCLTLHEKTMIHTIEQVSTSNGHVEFYQVRITPEERQRRIEFNKRQKLQYKKCCQTAIEMLLLY